MELDIQTKSNLKQLGFEMSEETDQFLENLAPQFGYTSMGYGTTYDDGTKGLLISMDEDHNQYNNGTYMLHKLKDGKLVMEVIVPNNKDRGDLIQKHVDEIVNHVDGMDLSDLQIYDQAEMWGFVLAQAVVKPLTDSIYPNAGTDLQEKVKRARFINLFMPRFLANIAHLYAGDDQMKEEAVNSEPYVLKLMIDSNTDKKDPDIAHPTNSDKAKSNHTEDEPKASEAATDEKKADK